MGLIDLGRLIHFKMAHPEKAWKLHEHSNLLDFVSILQSFIQVTDSLICRESKVLMKSIFFTMSVLATNFVESLTIT